MIDRADAALPGHHQPSSPRIQVNFVVGPRAIACCLKQPLTVIIMVIFAISANFLVWGIHLFLTVKHPHKTSRAGHSRATLLLTLCPVVFKTQAWSSSIKLWDEGRIPGASSPLLHPGSALAWCQGSANGTCWSRRGEEPSGAIVLGER